MKYKIPVRKDLVEKFQWRLSVEDKLHKVLTKLAFDLSRKTAMDWLENTMELKVNNEVVKIDNQKGLVYVKEYVFRYDFSVINRLSKTLVEDEYMV